MIEHQPDLPFSFQSPVAVVCHDAGAANLVFAWLRDWARCGLLDQHEFRLVLQGPALVAWHAQAVALPNMQLHAELHTALAGAHSVLTGTGWASNLEHDARQLASLQHIPCIAVIDHWVNYQPRFERAGEVVLPDAIWVSDPYAADMATQIFKGIPVIELPNVYLQDMVKAIAPVQPDCRNLLYVLEPIRNDWGRGLAGEFQALDFFALHVAQMVEAQPVHITLRPHPSDAPGKYDAWIQAHAHLNVGLDTHPTLNQAITNAKWVVGAETFAMVVADAAGRQTYSSLPPLAHRCSLPQTSIKHLRDLVHASNG
jgi:hypothetical protein